MNAFTKKDLVAAKQFPMDVYFNFWKPQIQCYINKKGKNGDIENFWKLVKFYTVEDSSKFSMNCNFRRMLNRVRYWQYVPVAETQATKQACKDGLAQALADRSKIISNTDADPRFTWTTPSEDDLAEEKAVENTEKINEIVMFLDDWENLDHRLYDAKGGRTVLINEYTKIAKLAMEVYYWYHRMGDQTMKVHSRKAAYQTKAYWFGKQVVENARTEFRQTCWRPLSQQLFLVTPRY